MRDDELSADLVRRTLALLSIEIDEEEAEALVPLIAANNRALATLDAFDTAEVRPAVVFDPTPRP